MKCFHLPSSVTPSASEATFQPPRWTNRIIMFAPRISCNILQSCHPTTGIFTVHHTNLRSFTSVINTSFAIPIFLTLSLILWFGIQ
ncbi:hypothetical protein CW304_15315 [Bacillus sp. UFRGS-B20]|nr:hypothetical protein CW304_15315 [Bacillus sp. UFRGS-B20]